MLIEINSRLVVKALITTALTLPPAIIPVAFEDTQHRVGAFFMYGLFIFVGSLIVFRTDQRFQAVREAAMDRQFDDLFRHAREQLGPGVRLPFRVYIFQPRMCWLELATVYMYNSHVTDRDYAQSFFSWHGLCGRVYWNGLIGWFDKRKHNPAEFHMTSWETQATSNVWACCCIPLRNVYGKSETTVSSVKAVISFDCLAEEYIDGLKEFHDKVVNNDQGFLDELTHISLYFT